MSYQKNIVSFLGPGELDQLVFYLQNATAEQFNKDIYDKPFRNPGIIIQSMEHDLLNYLSRLKPVQKARLCHAAKVFYLKNKK
mgnify:CR=1 FL=1